MSTSPAQNQNQSNHALRILQLSSQAKKSCYFLLHSFQHIIQSHLLWWRRRLLQWRTEPDCSHCILLWWGESNSVCKSFLKVYSPLSCSYIQMKVRKVYRISIYQCIWRSHLWSTLFLDPVIAVTGTGFVQHSNCSVIFSCQTHRSFHTTIISLSTLLNTGNDQPSTTQP